MKRWLAVFGVFAVFVYLGYVRESETCVLRRRPTCPPCPVACLPAALESNCEPAIVESRPPALAPSAPPAAPETPPPPVAPPRPTQTPAALTAINQVTPNSGAAAPSATVELPRLSFRTVSVPVVVRKPAELVVTVPTDARLFFDERPTTQTATERRFVTPELEPGRTYYYVLRVDTIHFGRLRSELRRVEVSAAAEVRVTFEGGTAP